jgi:protein TonB
MVISLSPPPPGTSNVVNAVTAAPVPSTIPVPVPMPTVIAAQTQPVSGPHIVAGPQERFPPARYVTPLDYPAALQGSGAQGPVGVVLTVNAQGKVAGCAVTRSSGWTALDQATCNLLARRARYTPARDSNGNPATGTIDQEIDWKLPPR